MAELEGRGRRGAFEEYNIQDYKNKFPVAVLAFSDGSIALNSGELMKKSQFFKRLWQEAGAKYEVGKERMDEMKVYPPVFQFEHKSLEIFMETFNNYMNGGEPGNDVEWEYRRYFELY